MTTQELKTALYNMLDVKAQTLANLYSRYNDEKGFEHISEYEEAFAKLLPEGFFVLKVSAKPFGFHFGCDSFKGASFLFCIKRGQASLTQYK